MAKVKLHTGTGVFAVLANVCRNPQEALKQFVENAADAVEEAGISGGHISIKLKYEPVGSGQAESRLKSIIIEDNGVGMAREKMRQVLYRIGDSEKINLALRGEQGIGILAFALIAEELHLASGIEEGKPSACLVLKRSWLKSGHADIIAHCPSHEHKRRGTTVFLEGILPEIAPQLSKAPVKDYLGQQFTSDLRANLYEMTISDDHEFEQIHPQHFRGVKVMSTGLPLGRTGSAFLELYVLPWETNDAAVSLYGRGGTRICALTDLADFKEVPWADRRLDGYIRCDRLKRTADKTAIVQDQTFNVFAAKLRKLEPKVQELILKVSAESQEQRFNVVLSRTSRLIDRFLRYREQGKLTDLSLVSAAITRKRDADKSMKPEPKAQVAGPKKHEWRVPTRAPHIRLYSPSLEQSTYRSWYDPGLEAICINREHVEFLLSQRENRRCMRYLFTIWAKESLLQEYGANAERIADEMVGVLAEAEPLIW
jgi:hypothetical protein